MMVHFNESGLNVIIVVVVVVDLMMIVLMMMVRMRMIERRCCALVDRRVRRVEQLNEVYVAVCRIVETIECDRRAA